MTFELLNRFTCAIFAALFVTLLFVPGVIYWLFAMEGGAGVDIMSRRAAMLFAGLATLTFLAQGATTSEARRIVSATITVAMAGLLVLGLVEWLRGSVGAGIWLALVVEGFFVFWYFRYWRE